MDFDLVGTLAEARSRVVMLYDDLRVEIVDRRNMRTREPATRLAEDFLIRPDNPAGHGAAPREGEGGRRRDPERSMWGNIWHALLPAMTKTVI